MLIDKIYLNFLFETQAHSSHVQLSTTRCSLICQPVGVGVVWGRSVLSMNYRLRSSERCALAFRQLPFTVSIAVSLSLVALKLSSTSPIVPYDDRDWRQ